MTALEVSVEVDVDVRRWPQGRTNEPCDVEGRHTNCLRPDRYWRGFGDFVGGALIDPITGKGGRAELAPLASVLAEHFTVYNYDRRGRAESGDTPPYALQREIEDLDAMIAEAGGGKVYVYGASSGGCLVLQAVAAGLSVSKLAVYDLTLRHR